MNTLEKAQKNIDSLQDLKKLLSEGGPCASIYMPLSKDSAAGLNPNAKQNELRWKESVRTLEPAANAFGEDGRALLDSLRSWDAVAAALPDEGTAGGTLAVFRSPEVFQVALLKEELPGHATLGPQFYIRPLLPSLTGDRTFYLLALSQKNTRLIRCTLDSSVDVPFPRDVHSSFDSWMNQVKPDHRDINNAMTAGRQGASGPSALAPKGADQDAQNEYLSHYFKHIDHGVSEVLKSKAETLILCAVEYETALYRQVNSYPHLACDDVRGAANGFKSGEMHARALDVLRSCYEKKIDDVLAEWNHRVGGGASSRLKEVITAAHEGRVLTLLISDSLEQPGVFDEVSFAAKGRPDGGTQDRDLVNDAAVETIRHGGTVLVAAQKKMPNGSPVAAIFRY